jgi:ABC-type sugar transport system ATPase subunit
MRQRAYLVSYVLHPQMRVRSNITFGLEMAGMARRKSSAQDEGG